MFKASPFHKLSDSQLEAEESILVQLAALVADSRQQKADERSSDRHPKLILVQGAGDRQNGLLSHLFYRIAAEIGIQGDTYSEDEDYPELSQTANGRLSSYILVNHKEQVHVYNQIATKLGCRRNLVKWSCCPVSSSIDFSLRNEHGRGISDQPQGTADIVLIDEAHLLMTQGNQGIPGRTICMTFCAEPGW